MPKQTLSQQLALRFSKLSYTHITPAARHSVKRLLLDYLGVALAGSQSESGLIARQFAAVYGGKGEVQLIGDSARVPMPVAAFANAISSHSIELDDIDVLALFHFSPPVYSAALAVAEAQRASGKQLIVALNAGCEMMERVSRAANNSLRNRAFHTTPTCGVFGATVAAAKLLQLSSEKITHALGMAGAQASGLMEMYGPSMQKRFNPGPTARNGVTAALMAQLGFTGADTIFEGERGFLRAFTDKNSPKALIEGLDKAYELLIEFKPYSCARPIHNAIDCALSVRGQAGFDITQVKSIQFQRHPDWVHYHQNKTPQTYHEAQVSLPFSVAVALLEGQALLAQYTDRYLRHPRIKQLSQITQITANAALPRGVSCKMVLTQKNGKRFSAQIDYPKGSIQNPMSDEELMVKFHSLANPVIGVDRAEALADSVWHLEKLRDLTELMHLTHKK